MSEPPLKTLEVEAATSPAVEAADGTRQLEELKRLVAGRRWYYALWARIMLGAIPLVALTLLWLIVSAHPPHGALQYAAPRIQPTLTDLKNDIVGQSPIVRSAILLTLEETAIGLVIAITAGFLLGVPMGLVRLVDASLYPIIVVLQAVPFVAITPLLALVFGFGIGSKVALAAVLSFFPILLNVIVGMKRIRLDEIDLLRSLGASRAQTFLKLRLPRAFGSIFAGLQVGILFALLGAVIGEIVGGAGEGNGGLGVQLTIRTQGLDIPGAFSVLIIISVMAASLTLLVAAMSRLLTNWKEL